MRTIILTMGLGLTALLAACVQPPEVTGRSLYTDYCVACHGTEGRGDGPLAAGLDRSVPDLTLISRRNGGSFPKARVMSVIDGYSRFREGNTTMPEFGVALQEGGYVSYDSGDGVMTPTPALLVDLATYLASIQR